MACPISSSAQIEINNQLVNYLQNRGYRSDPIIDELVEEIKGGQSVNDLDGAN